MLTQSCHENVRRLHALGHHLSAQRMFREMGDAMTDDVLTGACSFFGGPNDTTMANDTGLALYEPDEATLRPDLFTPAPAMQSGIATWMRLRPEAPYLAMRFGLNIPRRNLQRLCLCVRNPRNGMFALGFPVDRGPGVMDRLIDLSPRFRLLGLDTNDEVQVSLALPGPMRLSDLVGWIPG